MADHQCVIVASGLGEDLLEEAVDVLGHHAGLGAELEAGHPIA